MEKINIAEILKDCPKGMELDCTIYDNAKLIGIDDRGGCTYPIKVAIGNGNTMVLTKYGQYVDADFGKCVIFPKGKTTWEVPPCKFKDGDIIFVKSKKSGVGFISIYKNESSHLFYDYCSVSLDTGTFYLDAVHGLIYKNDISISRLAIKEEKEKLFNAIKTNGYKWNAEKKELQKLVVPKFKVGDRVKKNKDYISGIVTDIFEDSLKVAYAGGGCCYVQFCSQDDWELVSNKFDISTLVTFESRVLVRSTNDDIWRPTIYGFTDSDRYFVVGGIYWKQCIPYKGNEHLLGSTDDCDEYFKTWE